MILKNGHISPEDPCGLICTKFGTAGLFADLIVYDIFGNQLRDFWYCEGSNFGIFLSPGGGR